MLNFFGQSRCFSEFSPFLHSATKTVLSCRCYRGTNLDASCCTEQRGGCFQRVYSVEKGVMIHKQPFSVQKNLLFPFSITIIPIGFLCLQLLPSRQIQNAPPQATVVLSPLPLAGTCHHDDPAPEQEKNSHRPQKTATMSHSLVPAQGGGRDACAGLMGPSWWPPLYPQHNLSYCSTAMKN